MRSGVLQESSSHESNEYRGTGHRLVEICPQPIPGDSEAGVVALLESKE